jgi:hypothetical protein
MSSRSLVLGVVLSPILLACGASNGNDPYYTGLTSLTGESGETGVPAADDHGSIRIEIVPAGDDLTILEDTFEIQVIVHYQTCLQDFYLFREPSYTLDQVDGAPVFADWMDRLCSDYQGGPECSVIDIDQSLIAANDFYILNVELRIYDPSTIANREIQVGPIPLAALAACVAGQQPSVELRQVGVIGKNVDGEIIWETGSLPAVNTAVADQATVLRVEVVPL